MAEILQADDGRDPVDALTELLERTGSPDPTMALRAESWPYAVRNPEAMAALTAQRR